LNGRRIRASSRGSKKMGEGVVARGTLEKFFTFFFTEHGTDPENYDETAIPLCGRPDDKN
jgi:hypothetical protein